MSTILLGVDATILLGVDATMQSVGFKNRRAKTVYSRKWCVAYGAWGFVVARVVLSELMTTLLPPRGMQPAGPKLDGTALVSLIMML